MTRFRGKYSSHASSCIPPLSPTAELSDLVNSLLPPAGNPFYQAYLHMLLAFFQGFGMTRDTMRSLYSDGNGETGLTDEALDALFDVPAARFADIARVINDLMLAPVHGVMGNVDEEGVSASLSSLTGVGHGDADQHRGDNAEEVGPPAYPADTLVGINGGANGQDGHTQRLNRIAALPGRMNVLVDEEVIPAAGQDGTDGRLLRPFSGSDSETTTYGLYGSASTPRDSNPQ
jgi:hypothetical protein